MKKFKIDVSWTMTASVEVEADTLAEAMDKVHDMDLSYFDAKYLDDSFNANESEKE